MATLNLGRIKPVFRGAYDASTAYVVDDIVTSSDETFICILASTGNATSNATYWTKLAAKGTDGTDVGTTITTQGDILFRDGSGLQRLAKGTAAQTLQMNSGATAPEWVTASAGGILQVKSAQTGAYFSTTSTGQGTSGYELTAFATTMTPAAASSHFLITGQLHLNHKNSYTGRAYLTYNHSGISETVIKSSTNTNGATWNFVMPSSSSGSDMIGAYSCNFHLAPNTTNDITFKLYMMTSNSGYATYMNGTATDASDSDDGGNTISSLTFWEIAGGITPAVTNASIDT